MRRRDAGELFVAQAGDVVDDGGAGIEARRRHRRARRVDRYARPLVHCERNDREDPLELLGGGHGHGSRAGRLATDVDDVRPLVEELEDARLRVLERKMAAAVAE